MQTEAGRRGLQKQGIENPTQEQINSYIRAKIPDRYKIGEIAEVALKVFERTTRLNKEVYKHMTI